MLFASDVCMTVMGLGDPVGSADREGSVGTAAMSRGGSKFISADILRLVATVQACHVGLAGAD